ncbi:hypothetical protein C8F04DRAFT_1340564 [Mycena alexandri]|uniref:DUF6534 domain-containing protein n=1 Tax=Mycena alexandri TaxID=1745969 RepID=A0AAD6WMC6_9AGAR|nr:hypothetical protein C8F04DRAFT_1201879 [Mycena alexandri]KAJ7016794.1 hypothetical protein C8F04DRAFT_1340564 [Mycena alexandri]
MNAPPSPSMASTYGAWFISLFVETVLYGVGILQAFLYYQWWGTDSRPTKLAATKVLSVMVLETVQLGFFFGSSYSRFVQRFGILQEDLIWWANFRWSGLILLSREQARGSIVGVYTVESYSFRTAAGTVQTIITYNLRSFSKLDQTIAVTTLQTAASLLCDIVITLHLCIYLARSKTGLPTTERLLNGLMINAVNRGFLTAITSTLTMILFLVFPHSFWFFLSIAPNSKSVYMNSMLATLNMRGHVWRKAHTANRDWDTINLGNVGTHETVSQVVFGTVDNTSHDGRPIATKGHPFPALSPY